MRSIPPKGSIPDSIRNDRARSRMTTSTRGADQGHPIKTKPKPVSKMDKGTLEQMLTVAESLFPEMQEVVRVDPSDDNLKRLDDLSGKITQIKAQIVDRD